MAERKTQTTVDTPTVEELNLDTKVTVKNIAGWVVGFSRKDGYGGDISIAPNGTMRLSRAEIIAQVQSGNRLFTGLDGMGSHATLFIDDIPTRIEVEFESEDGKKKQNVFSDEKVKSLFALSQTKFQNEFKEAICTRAEKYAVIDAIKRLKINDFEKMRFVEDYTGYKIQ